MASCFLAGGGLILAFLLVGTSMGSCKSHSGPLGYPVLGFSISWQLWIPWLLPPGSILLPRIAGLLWPEKPSSRARSLAYLPQAPFSVAGSTSGPKDSHIFDLNKLSCYLATILPCCHKISSFLRQNLNPMPCVFYLSGTQVKLSERCPWSPSYWAIPLPSLRCVPLLITVVFSK